jgi:type VI secretion system protein ImpB
MSSESVHQKLNRVRKPRVHITYEVETEGAQVVKELPFVVGVLGDLSGNAPAEKPKPLRDRRFVQIDRDNFNAVMKQTAPGLNIRVENTIANDGSETAVQLKFDSLEAFEPAQVAEQVPQLKSLLDTRNKLRDLLTKIDRSENLESILENVLSNTEQRDKLAAELGVTPPEEKK